MEQAKAAQAKTTVVNIRNHPHDFDIYVGRPGLGLLSEFYNPYTLRKDGTREDILAKFRKYFHTRITTDQKFREKVLALAGKRLGCICANSDFCHATIIARYLNNTNR